MIPIPEGWILMAGDIQKIQKEFEWSDFKEAMQFVNAIAEKAEEKQHHPEITIDYNKVIVTLWTHSVNGLTEKDSNLAEEIDHLSSK